MLSILIPIYNFDCNELVQRLSHQANYNSYEIEIICMDDASSPEFRVINAGLKDLPHVKYFQLYSNLGRAHIRNELARVAQFSYLLFMDCDSMPHDDYYLERYTRLLPTEQIICGGRSYQIERPDDQRFLLHWTYGTEREQKDAATRNKTPHHGFMTNNFLIPKHIMEQFPFDAEIKQYGHEDTLFGFKLKEVGIPIHHIDNQLLHIGLEERSIFLEKQKKAIENLVELKAQYPELQTRLTQFADKFEGVWYSWIMRFLLRVLRSKMETDLNADPPSIKALDMIKMEQYLQLRRKQKYKS
ncbi:MAG: glycosyltransferase family 2 protein [Bacteroidota bacterium]